MDYTKKNGVLVPKQRLFAPMLSTFGGGSIRGFMSGGGAAVTIDDVTVTTSTGPSVPSNMTTGPSYNGFTTSKDSNNNRMLIRQTERLGSNIGSSNSDYWAYINNGGENQYSSSSWSQYGQQYTIAADGIVWIALQGAGGCGGLGGYGGSGGGAGGFVLVQVDLREGTGTYTLYVAHGYWATKSSFGAVSDFNAFKGVNTELYRGSTLLARAEGGGGGRTLNNGDSTQNGGSGGSTSVLTSDSAILASYVADGGDGGPSNGSNSNDIASGGSPAGFDYTNPSTTISSAIDGLTLNSTYYGTVGGGASCVGSNGYNSWKTGASASITNGDVVKVVSDNDTTINMDTCGYMGGGSGAQDRSNNGSFGTFTSPGYAVIYGEEAIS